MDMFLDNNKKLAELLFPDVNIDISELEKRFPERKMEVGAEVTRFAPSITGHIHLGGLYAALISNKLAEQSNGIFYLRIEDIDQELETEDEIRKTVNDLEKFGISFDEGPFPGIKDMQSYGPYRQSERKDIYQACAKKLIMEGKAYPCFCKNYESRGTKQNQQGNKKILGCYGAYARCSKMTYREIAQKIEKHEKYVIRIRANGSQEKISVFHDLVKGDIEMPENTNDVVILKRDGMPTYHFAHIVDDYFMRTTTVIRGDEWLSSWPIHRQLYQLCGFREPKYIHIAPIAKAEGNAKRRLSKYQDEEAVSVYYYKKGLPVRAILEYFYTIMNSNYEEWNTHHVDCGNSKFMITMEKMSKSSTLLDMQKLMDISKNVISDMTVEECLDEITGWAREYDPRLYKVAMINPQKFLKSIELWKQTNGKKRKDVSMWSEVFDKYDYLYNTNWLQNGGTVSGRFDLADTKLILSEYANQFKVLADRNEWLTSLKDIAGKMGYTDNRTAYKTNPDMFKGTFVDFCAVIRMAITGKENSPDLFDIISFLGEEEIKSRLVNQIRLNSFVCDYLDTNLITKKSVYDFKNSMSKFQMPMGSFVVSTCLRYEIFGVNQQQEQQVKRKNMVHLEGKQALARFIRLLVGEYSELKGEIEIRNQVRRGLCKAYSEGAIQENEFTLIDEIIEFADGLREKYQLTNKENYSTLACRLLMEKWNNRRRKSIMILGDGYMAQSFYEKMREKETRFIFVNRDVKKARNIFGTPDNAVHTTYESMGMFVPLVDAVFIALSNVDQSFYQYETLFQNRELCMIDISYPAVFEGTGLVEYITLDNYDWVQMCPHIQRNKQLYVDIERYVNRKCIE